MTNTTYRIDPENNEINTLLQLSGPLTHKRILEIGCGTGRLTWRYAPHAQEIVGIDPNAERIAEAKRNTSAADTHRIHFHTADLLTYHPPQPFDLAILSWSL